MSQPISDFLGITQYIAPTLQLLVGVGLYGEPFSGQKLVGYLGVWAALLIYSFEGIWQARQVRKLPMIGA